jgi:AsmA family protein
MSTGSHGYRNRYRYGSALLVILLVVMGIVVGEAAGWPFLARPIEKQMTKALNRKVSLSTDDFKIRFFGKLRIEVGELIIAPPTWSKTEFMVNAKTLKLTLNYSDLWAAYKGEKLHLVNLQAEKFTSHLERLADARVSWKLRETPSAPPPIPTFGRIEVADGLLSYKDALSKLNLEVKFSTNAKDKQFTGQAKGDFRDLPLKVSVTSSGTLPWESGNAGAPRIGLRAEATIGRATFIFNGSATDVASMNDVVGQFTLKGPSLSAVGDPVGVTLPTTAAFNATGNVAKKSDQWSVVIKSMTIGASNLSGAFKFSELAGRKTLSGRLTGVKLKLADLGPAIGTISGLSKVSQTKVVAKVLPTRPFDLAAMRVMDANVLIDISEVDLNTSLLEPLQPFKAHLQLQAGVLTLSNIDARTAQGRLGGNVKLDGKGSKALWTAALQWDKVQLERWLRFARKDGLPPYVSGQLSGNTKLAGEGRSTSEILASLQGTARTQLKNGSVSHLLVEAIGIDIAQAIGVFIKGDDALPVTCGIADLLIAKGVFKPRVMVIDTKDSAIWVEGSLSLATEAMEFKAIVVPKDFSPLTLRAPILVSGTFSQPKVTIEKGTLAAKIGGALLLGLINPFAALIPLIDFGDSQAADEGAAGCINLAKKATKR